MDDLDLETGDAALADASPAERRRRARATAQGSKGSGSAGSKPTVTDAEVGTRLHRTFERLALWREARNDTELAEIIREDSEQMEQGIVSLTKNAPFLRGPLMFFLNVVEPVLAFQRIVRTLLYRWQDRRERQSQEQPQEQQEYQPDFQVVQ